MTGLLLKDLYCLKQNIKSTAFILFVWSIVFLPQKDGGLLIIYLFVMISAMHIFTLSSYDKQAGWDTYALSMPFTRANMVQEKYITFLLLLIVSVLVSSGLVILSWLIRKNGPAGEFLPGVAATAILGAGMSLIYSALALPASLGLGPEKGRYIPSLMFIAIFFTGFFMAKSRVFQGVSPRGLGGFSLMTLGLAVFLFAASYFISLAIYKKKEF